MSRTWAADRVARFRCHTCGYVLWREFNPGRRCPVCDCGAGYMPCDYVFTIPKGTLLILDESPCLVAV